MFDSLEGESPLHNLPTWTKPLSMASPESPSAPVPPYSSAYPPGTPIADRIREAIEASGDGLSKSQIRRLFHGHVEGNRIDAGLEILVALGALTTQSEPTGGRPSTLWSAVEDDEQEANEESLSEDEESAEGQLGGF
jgi:hypothetical protein